jgi:uncharacterized membrane protein
MMNIRGRWHLRILDAALWVYAVGILAILVSGGFSFTVLGYVVRARRPYDPALAFGVIFWLRRRLGPEDSWEAIPIMRAIIAAVHRIGRRLAWSPAAWAWLLAGAYAVMMSGVTVLRHAAYQSTAYDLGIFDQVLWNTVYGDRLFSSILGHHFFGEHFSPILLVVAHLYRVAAHPAALLIVQSAALASGALPVYWLARQQLHSPAFAALFVGLYVGYQPLRNLNVFDFHAIALATPLLLFACWFLEQRRYVWFGVCLLAALGCKEEVAAIVVIFGVYLAINHKKRLAGGLLALSGAALFFLLIEVIIPHYRQAPFVFVERYSYLGDSVSAIVRTLLTRPLYVAQHVFTEPKFRYIFRVFGPLGFMSLLSPSRLLLAMPTLVQNILSASPHQYSIRYHYTAPLTAFVFVSAIHGARNLLTSAVWRRRLRLPMDLPAARRALAAVLIWCAVLHYGPTLPAYLRQYARTPHARLTTEFLRRIPAQAAVSAQDTLVPHLSQRPEMYVFPNIAAAEYIALDTSASTVPLSADEYQRAVEVLLDGDAYRVIEQQGSLLLLQRRDAAVEKR